MAVPRSWTAIEKQRDPEQAHLMAQPVATDARFKAAAFLLFCGWVTTVFSLHHSIKHYKSLNNGLHNRAYSTIRYVPRKLLLTLPTSLIMIGYEAAIAFDFSISPLNIDPNLPVVYLLGWLPIAIIFVVFEIAGFCDPNEDRELIRQRRIRGAEADTDIGITMKPHWWSRLHGDDQPRNVRDAIARNVNELGGVEATHGHMESIIEMRCGPATSAKVQLPIDATEPGMQSKANTRKAPSIKRGRRINEPESSGEDNNRLPRIDRSDSTNSGNTLVANQQQIRSMLDV